MTNKVKVTLAKGIRKYIEIEVCENEVDAVKAVNRMTWNEIDKQKRQKKILEEEGITICSLDSVEKGGSYIADENPTPIEILIEIEEEAETKAKIHNAMQHLNDEQRAIVQMRFYENKELSEIAENFGVSYQAIQCRIETILKKLKNIFNLPCVTP